MQNKSEETRGICWVLTILFTYFVLIRCRNGYKCRFLKAHMDENNKLIINKEVYSHIVYSNQIKYN